MCGDCVSVNAGMTDVLFFSGLNCKIKSSNFIHKINLRKVLIESEKSNIIG